jgi:hypothetical protein
MKIVNIHNTKCLELLLDNIFPWKIHIGTAVTKLSSACYTIRTVKPFLPQEPMKMVYCSYFHSIIIYKLICWGNICYSNIIFRLQKKLLELLWGLETDTLAEYILEN